MDKWVISHVRTTYTNAWTACDDSECFEGWVTPRLTFELLVCTVMGITSKEGYHGYFYMHMIYFLWDSEEQLKDK